MEQEVKSDIKDCLQREESLSNSRVSSILTFQGLLFASSSLLLNEDKMSVISLVFVGSISAFTVFTLGVLSALYVYKLHEKWREVSEGDLEVLSPFGLQKSGKYHMLSIFSYKCFLPLLCSIAWPLHYFFNIS